MLHDFLALEEYYGASGCHIFLDDLSARYPAIIISIALKGGDIVARPLTLGPDAGRTACWLTDKGRRKVAGRQGECPFLARKTGMENRGVPASQELV